MKYNNCSVKRLGEEGMLQFVQQFWFRTEFMRGMLYSVQDYQKNRWDKGGGGA